MRIKIHFFISHISKMIKYLFNSLFKYLFKFYQQSEPKRKICNPKSKI